MIRGLFTVALAMCGFGGCLLKGVIDANRRARAVASWPSTAGKVTEASVRETHHDSGGVSYLPHVTYNYTVNGFAYACQQIAASPLFTVGSSEEARRYIARHALGTAVTVYYDPQNPSDAIPEHGTSDANALAVGAFGAMLLIAGLLLPIRVLQAIGG